MDVTTRGWLTLGLLAVAGCGDPGGPNAERSVSGADEAGAWTAELGMRGDPPPARGRPEISDTAHSSKTPIDTAEGLFRAIHEQELAPSSSLPVLIDEQTTLMVTLDSLSLEDGYFALKGRVDGTPAGVVMLKGTRERISGWIAFRQAGFAYRYRTEDALVVVEQIPFSWVCPSCDHPLPRRHLGSSEVADPPALHAPPVASAPPTAEAPHIGSYPGTDLLTLESRPLANKVIYLNIEGVLDTSGTPQDFSKEEMWKAWQSVAAAFSPFEVNVTTNPSVYDSTPARDRGKANFTSSDEWAECYVDSFGTNWSCEIYTGPGAEPEQGYGVGRTTAHELGHLMGAHDVGTSTTPYFEGFEAYRWYPRMGNYYYATDRTNSLIQWTKGEYAGANDTTDMLAMISSELPFRDDDIPDTQALEITSSNEVSSITNRGIIERNTDTDSFTFQIGASGGEVNLTIDRIEYVGGAMLDVQTTLQDSSESTLAISNAEAARGATIHETLDEGTYTLIIEGGAEGTPSNGFSSYGSLGYYGIEGTITGAETVGAGGRTNTGGDTGTGGDTEAGGSTNTGGDTGTGGVGGTGGDIGTGGHNTSTGGDTEAGGSSAGATGSVATAATGGTTAAGTGGASDPGTGGLTSSGSSAGASGAAATCEAPFLRCGSVCADVAADPINCGACGVSCSAGQVCSAGQCATPCAAGTTPCGQFCADLLTDPSHCGTCGTACPAGQACQAGLCTQNASAEQAPLAPTTTQSDGGCGCSTGRRRSAGGWLSVALALLVAARRRQGVQQSETIVSGKIG